MKLVQAVTQILHEHAIFQGLDAGKEALIADCASLAVFQAGEFLYREQQDANRFYIIRHGRVALEVHAPARGNIIVDMLKAGDVLGWSWLIPPYRSNFDARAVELTRAIAFDAACLRGKMEADPVLGYQMFKRMMPLVAARLAAARRQMLDLYGKPQMRPEPAGLAGAEWR